jgi:hypothetical protein
MKIRRNSRLATFLSAGLLAALAACSGEEDPGTSPISITLSLSPSTASITQGGTASVGVVVSRSGDAGTITIAASGLPTGVTAGALTLASGTNTGTLSLTATSTATTGTSNVTITASASGATSVTQTLALTVNAASQPASITLSASPASISVVQGASGTTGITINRTNFTSAVNLAATGMPTGVTASFNPASPTTTSSTLTLAVPASTPAGTSTITITGSGTGVTNATTTVSLTVTAAPATGSFTLALNPSNPTVTAGQTTTSTINITRTGGYSGAITFALTGAPTGLTASFSPTSATVGNNSVTMTLTAASTLAAGNYNVTLAANGPNAAPGLVSTAALDVTLTFSVTVQAAPTTGGNVSLTFCGATGIPTAVFYQNGTSGAWTAATNSSGTWTANITDNVGGIAYVVENSSGSAVYVQYMSRTELQGYSQSVCFGSTGTKTVNLSVSGLSTFDFAGFALGNSIATAVGASGGAATFNNVRTGPVDFFGGKATGTLSGSSVVFDLTRVYMQRGIDPAAGSTLSPDLNGANSGTPASATATINNMNGESTILSAGYRTSGGSFGILAFDAGGTTATRTWKGFPSSMQQSGDLHFLQASAGTTNIRSTTVLSTAVANRTLTLGAALSPVTVTTLRSTAPLRLQASVARQSEYATVWSFAGSQGSKSVSIQATVGYIGTASPVVLAFPDFSGVTGFNNAWWPASGSPFNWVFGATGYSATNPFVDGAVINLATQSGSITP